LDARYGNFAGAIGFDTLLEQWAHTVGWIVWYMITRKALRIEIWRFDSCLEHGDGLV
jgi:hypothetical protein